MQDKNKEIEGIAKENVQTKEKKPVKPRVEWDKLQENFKGLTKSEEKIKLLLEFMRNSISQKGSPVFKDFWDAKKLCLDLFKESIHPIIRDILWKEYVDLSKEAHNLKEILNEQSSFLSEQLTIAVDALEKEISEIEKLVSGLKNVHLNLEGTILNRKKDLYQELQKQAIVFEAFANRISNLRKEVLKADIRVRFKNKFLDQLTALADKVYPQKKQVLQKISQEFVSDITEFRKKFDSQKEWNQNVIRSLRLEVQNLQKVAKEFSLTPSAFMETRNSLGECWAIIVEKEKERKEEFLHKKEAWDKALEEATTKVEELRSKVGTKEFTTAKQQLLDYAKTNLSRDGLKKIEGELDIIENEVVSKGKIQNLQKKKEQKEAIELLEKNCLELVKTAKNLSYEELFEKVSGLVKNINFTEDNLELLSCKISLEDMLFKKKAKELSKLNIEELEALLIEREKAKAITKQRIEKFRKMLGGSGLSFEQSIKVRDLIESEKERLEDIEESIEDIANRIVKIK